jgi:hypothetical protein
MPKSNYHNVKGFKEANLFFDIKDGRFVMTAEVSSWRESTAPQKGLYSFVTAVVNNTLRGDAHGMKEEFLNLNFDVSKLLTDELQGCSMDGKASGKIRMSSEYKDKFTKLSEEFKKLAVTLDAIVYE